MHTSSELPDRGRVTAKTERLISATHPLTVAEAQAAYAAPAGLKQRIQLIRPFLVMSKTSYSSPLVPPIGIAYIASLLEASGYLVDIIDGVGEDVGNVRISPCGNKRLQGLTAEAIIDRIAPETTIVGLSLMYSQEWIEHRELIEDIRKKRPDLTIVAGGEHITALPEHSLRNCPDLDFVVTGEGELTFLELAHNIVTGQSTENIRGVGRLDKQGVYQDDGIGPRIADIKSLPKPAWHLCPIQNYFSKAFAFGVSFGRNMPILATRGCPYQCTFCSNPTMWTTRYLMRDPEDVVDEIESMINTYGCNSIDFADLTAIVKRGWILDFCAEIKRREINIVWQLPTGTRAEALDEETLTAIYDAGCRLVVYAPESGSEETLVLVKKKLKLKKVLESAATASRVGHMTKVNFILGFPGETRKSMLETVWACIRMATKGVGDCNVAMFSPYPGSEIFRSLVESKEINIEDDQYFNDLVAFFDFTNFKTFNENVSSRELGYYRILGLSGFYLVSYLFYPKRILRLVKAMISDDFQPQSLFEQRVYDLLARSKSAKEKQA